MDKKILKKISVIAGMTSLLSGAAVSVDVHDADAKGARVSVSRSSGGAKFGGSSVKVGKIGSAVKSKAFSGKAKSWKKSKIKWGDDFDKWNATRQYGNISPINLMIWSNSINSQHNIDMKNIDTEKMENLFEVVDDYYSDNTPYIYGVEKMLVGDEKVIVPMKEELNAQFLRNDYVIEELDITRWTFSEEMASIKEKQEDLIEEFWEEKVEDMEELIENKQDALNDFDEELKDVKDTLNLDEFKLAAILRESIADDKLLKILEASQLESLKNVERAAFLYRFKEAVDDNDGEKIEKLVSLGMEMRDFDEYKPIETASLALAKGDIDMKLYKTILSHVEDDKTIKHVVDGLNILKDKFNINPFGASDKEIDDVIKILSKHLTISQKDIKNKDIDGIYKKIQARLVLDKMTHTKA